jgi:hypothetical protein
MEIKLLEGATALDWFLFTGAVVSLLLACYLGRHFFPNAIRLLTTDKNILKPFKVMSRISHQYIQKQKPHDNTDCEKNTPNNMKNKNSA